MTNRIVSFLILPLFLCGAWMCAGAQQPLPHSQDVVDVTGHWVIEAKNWNGDFDTKTVDLEQQGNAITGHFKGPNQSGGLDGSINGHHIVFRTKTKHPLTFRGQVQGDTMTGNFHVMGKEGEFHAERTAAK
jgi:hypothetical protein